MRLYLPAVIVFLLSSQVIAQNISIHDFVIPESRYTSLHGNLNGNFGNSRNGDMSSNGELNGGQINLSLWSTFGYNSEKESYTVHTNVNGAYRQNSYSNNYDYFIKNSRSNESTYKETNIFFSGQYSSYLTPDKIYFYGSTSLNGSYSLSNSESDTNNVRERVSFNKTRHVMGTIGFGAGFGKIREASSVFAVVRVIEKLNEDGYLIREPNKEEMLELVSIYARRIEYLSAYERPTKYFLDDLFKKLGTLGMLKDQQVSAYEVARIEEVFNEFIFPRLFGWTIQGGMEIGRNQREQTADQYYYMPRIFSKSDQNNLLIKAAYGHPFSLFLHWYTEAFLSLPFYGKQNKVDQSIKTSLHYQVGEKLSNELNVSYVKKNLYQTGNVFFEGFSFSNLFAASNTVRYFLENNINFSLTVSYNDWLNINEYKNTSTRFTSGGMNVSFGLNYRFF